ncbi:MAG: hypothetical protein ACR2HJ_01145 [Fimbriimonadales bacterium]
MSLTALLDVPLATKLGVTNVEVVMLAEGATSFKTSYSSICRDSCDQSNRNGDQNKHDGV